jgi:hypothetical protein
VERLAKDKYFSLIRTAINYGRKSFITLNPGSNGIKNNSHNYEFSQSASAFVRGKSLQPSLMFVSKASTAPKWCFARVSSSLTCKN